MSWLRNLNPLTRGSNERVAVLDHQLIARDPWQAKLQLDRDEQRFLSGATELWWVREGLGSTAWEDAVPKLVTAESLLGEHAHLTGQKRLRAAFLAAVRLSQAHLEANHAFAPILVLIDNFPHFLYHRTFAGIVEESPTLHKIALDGSPRWPYANLFSRILKYATAHPALPAEDAHAAHESLDNPDRSDVRLVTDFPTAFRVFRACLALDDAVVSRGRTRERADDRHGPTLAEVLVATHGEGERHL